jgi:tRNA threonylcarbamoyladenosine biosynthesis protein TsaB
MWTSRTWFGKPGRSVHYYHPLMLVLALDTTTRAGSCALARDGMVLVERSSDTAEHASTLPRDLMALLEASDFTLEDVDVFAVATGPGSFTGLRIGIATMQGLAFAGSRPLIGVSSFDALAQKGGDGRLATWIDAWRGEVYAALYEKGRAVREPVVARPADVLDDIRGGPTRFIGDGAATFRSLIEQSLEGWGTVADPPTPPLAGAIAVRATADAQRGECPPPHAIRPLYVRRTDAELVRDARALR